jgi:hypothetical protein
MLTRAGRHWGLWHVLALAMALVWRCGTGPADRATDEQSAEPAAKTEPAFVEDLEAKLALADGFDGTADRIVSRCPGCALGMDGSAEHAMQLGGYELRFCSANCMNGFAANPQARVLDLVIPEARPEPFPPEETGNEG